MRLTKQDIETILESMKWNRYSFQQKKEEDCYNKKETIKEMDRVINKLKGRE